MKKMKFLGLLTVLASLFQCASITFEKNPPFTINAAYYNNYVGGMPGSSGAKVKIDYKATTDVVFDSIFFQNKKAKVELETQKNKTFAKGHFNTSFVNSKKDLILHREGKKEYGNTPPDKKPRFDLKENQAVISYLVNGKTKYFKIEKMKKTKTDIYPSARPK